MARVNTEKMVKVSRNGKEYAFGKARKNEYGEWVVKVYINGEYSEDCTIYADSKEDAEATRDAEIANMAKREEAKAEDEQKAIAEYNEVMLAISQEHLTIGTSFSDKTEGWNLRDMVAEADYQLSTYSEWGHMNCDLKQDDPIRWKSETGKLKKFISKHKAKALEMKATDGHCSRFDN